MLHSADTEHPGGDAFRDSTACRAAFDRIVQMLGDVGGESPDTRLRTARTRIAFDAAATVLLREHGFRFAEPPSESVPFLLAVNGNQRQRDAVTNFGGRRMTIADLVDVWPQTLVWFVRL